MRWLLLLALACHADKRDGGGDDDDGPADAVEGIDLVAGERDTCLLHDGRFLCWGDTNGDDAPSYEADLENVAELTIGGLHLCSRQGDGTARCWGRGMEGQLGDDQAEQSDEPVVVEGLADLDTIEAGTYHTCAANRSGAVWCWGDNTSHQVGDGSDLDRYTPVEIDVQGILQLALGWQYSCGRRTDGTVWCWGDGSPAGQPEPWASDAGDIQYLAGGLDHVCGIDFWGDVYCWGDNGYGQLGAGDTDPHAGPVQVEGLGVAEQVACGAEHSCARLDDGTVWCWGDNSSGELGIGSGEPSYVPVQVVDMTGAVDLAAHTGRHTCVLREDDTVWCWGDNWAGQLGDGTHAARAVPVRVL